MSVLEDGKPDLKKEQWREGTLDKQVKRLQLKSLFWVCDLRDDSLWMMKNSSLRQDMGCGSKVEGKDCDGWTIHMDV